MIYISQFRFKKDFKNCGENRVLEMRLAVSLHSVWHQSIVLYYVYNLNEEKEEEEEEKRIHKYLSCL